MDWACACAIPHRQRLKNVDAAQLGIAEQIGKALSNGWVACGLSVLVAIFFYRKAEKLQEKYDLLREKFEGSLRDQNDLAKQVTNVMERLEAKAERRR
jgi:predicted nuclease with TOPRIM domain